MTLPCQAAAKDQPARSQIAGAPLAHRAPAAGIPAADLYPKPLVPESVHPLVDALLAELFPSDPLTEMSAR